MLEGTGFWSFIPCASAACVFDGHLLHRPWFCFFGGVYPTLVDLVDDFSVNEFHSHILDFFHDHAVKVGGHPTVLLFASQRQSVTGCPDPV